MSATVFNDSQMITGMCLWEAFMEVARVEGPASDLLGEHGSFTIRGALVDLVEPCDDAWAAVESMEGEAPVFDWEWCPDFIRSCIKNGLMRKALDGQYGHQKVGPRVMAGKTS